MELSDDVEKKLWQYLERLGLYCFKPEIFCRLINDDCKITIPANLYSEGEIDLEHYIAHEESKFIKL